MDKNKPKHYHMGARELTYGLKDLFARAGCHMPENGHPWHMLRHSFASAFIMAGGSLFTLQRLLGHASPSMTMRYSHLAPDFLANEIARLDFTPQAPAGVTDINQGRKLHAVGKGA